MLVKFGILIFSLLFWSANSMESNNTEDHNQDHNRLNGFESMDYETKEARVVVPEENDYTFKIRNGIAKNIWKDGNGVFNSDGLRALFALVYVASQGNTERALNTLFEYDTFPQRDINLKTYAPLYHPVDFYTQLRKDFKAITDYSNGSVELRLASTVFVNSKLRPDDLYTEALSRFNDDNGGKLIQVMDFFGNKKYVIQAMNQFFKDNAKITDNTVDESIIDRDTSLVLMNSIYLEGKWLNVFQKEEKGYFYYSNTKGDYAVYPKMLYQFREAGYGFNYIEAENLSRQGFQLLEMKFAGSDISLVIELPATKNFQEYVPLSRTEFEDFFRKMEKPDLKMRVTVPDFDIAMKYEKNLKELLKNMGLADIFSEKDANFPLLMHEKYREDRERDYVAQISDILTYAKISVKREVMQCIGYSSFKSSLKTRGGPSMEIKPIIEFKADHGFHFYVVDRNEKHKINGKHAIYFVGQLTDPHNDQTKKEYEIKKLYDIQNGDKKLLKQKFLQQHEELQHEMNQVRKQIEASNYAVLGNCEDKNILSSYNHDFTVMKDKLTKSFDDLDKMNGTAKENTELMNEAKLDLKILFDQLAFQERVINDCLRQRI